MLRDSKWLMGAWLFWSFALISAVEYGTYWFILFLTPAVICSAVFWYECRQEAKRAKLRAEDAAKRRIQGGGS